MTFSVPHHEDIRANFDAVLAELRQGMVEMSTLIADNLRRAGEAMRHSKLELIPEVRAVDEQIDANSVHLERLAFETIAR